MQTPATRVRDIPDRALAERPISGPFVEPGALRADSRRDRPVPACRVGAGVGLQAVLHTMAGRDATLGNHRGGGRRGWPRAVRRGPAGRWRIRPRVDPAGRRGVRSPPAPREPAGPARRTEVERAHRRQRGDDQGRAGHEAQGGAQGEAPGGEETAPGGQGAQAEGIGRRSGAGAERGAGGAERPGAAWCRAASAEKEASRQAAQGAWSQSRRRSAGGAGRPRSAPGARSRRSGLPACRCPG
jgi:hypothetical protein